MSDDELKKYNTVDSSSFVTWIYCNIQDDIDVNEEFDALKRLDYDYKLDEHGWLIEKSEISKHKPASYQL